jgi:hypothetical protein
MLKQVIDIYELLDGPHASGETAANFSKPGELRIFTMKKSPAKRVPPILSGAVSRQQGKAERGEGPDPGAILPGSPARSLPVPAGFGA